MAMQVDTRHEQVQRYLTPWRLVEDVAVVGARAVKGAKELYLPMLGWRLDVRDQEYRAYIERALCPDIAKQTHRGLVGLVFRKPADVKVPPALSTLLSDVTLTGIDFNTFAKLVFAQVVAPGRCGVLVDQAANDPFTPSEPQPYMTWYKATNILNWWTVRLEGRQVLARVVLREEVWDVTGDPFAPKKVEQIRVVELVPGGAPSGYDTMPQASPRWLRHATYRQHVGGTGPQTDWIVVKEDVIHRRGVALNFIPFVFLNPTTTEPDCEEPPLLGLSELNISMYQNSADLENGRHWTGRPQPYLFGITLAPGEQVRYGSQMVWTSPSADAKCGFAEFTGQGLGALEKAIQEKKKLAVELGARLVDPHPVNTATEAVLRSIAEHSVLSSMATATGVGLRDALLYQCWWAHGSTTLDDMREQVTVMLNQEFTATIMSATDAEAWARTAQLGNALSQRDLFELYKRSGVYPTDRTYEEHRALLALDGGGDSPMGNLAEIDPNAPPIAFEDTPPPAPATKTARSDVIAGTT